MVVEFDSCFDELVEKEVKDFICGGFLLCWFFKEHGFIGEVISG